MLEWRAACAERSTCGSGRRSREAVRLRPASYSTPDVRRLVVPGRGAGFVLATGDWLVDAIADGNRPCHARLIDVGVATPTNGLGHCPFGSGQSVHEL